MPRHPLTPRLLAGVVLIASTGLLAACSAGSANGATDAGASDPIVFGVSGPFTGDSAEYGQNWKNGIDLYVSTLNDAGGVDGRKVEIDYQDSQNEPNQAANIAQKFAADDRILGVIGDFSSPTSMAASPIYQREGVTQIGITNSHPDFTNTGDYIFSTSFTQETEVRALENKAATNGKKLGIVYIDTDWGKNGATIFADEAKANGDDVVFSEGVAEDSKDLKPTLIKLRDSGADAVVLLTYYQTGSLVLQQAEQVGAAPTFISGTSNYSPELIELSGGAAEGVEVLATFYADDTEPRIADFVTAYRTAYDTDPNWFSGVAYDGIAQLVWAFQNSDGSREGIRDALTDADSIDSVVLGPFSYNAERRASDPAFVDLVVRDGAYVRN